MSLELFGFIKDLVKTNPAGTDPKSEGDDHLRGIKATLQNQFPGFTQGKPITLTEDELNGSSYKKIYPIGAVFMSVNDVDPATLFAGTTWARIATGTFLMSGDATTNPIGTTGGEAAHVLTGNEMPIHSHVFDGRVQGLNVGAGVVNAIVPGGSYGTSTSGGNAAHNNLPPYLAVNMWQRTA